jgi:ABC-type branched-subunit amino acid transport system substrate-binding protein
MFTYKSIRPRFRILSAGVLLSLLATGLAACGSSSGSSSSNSQFVVGAVFPLSGAFSSVGLTEEPALQAIADYYNKHGGVDGHKIVIHAVNDNSAVQQAITATRSLVSKYNMNLFFPDTISAETLASLPLAPNVLSVDVCASSACGDAQTYPLSFSMNPPPQALFQATAQYIKSKGYTKVGMISDDDTSGQTFDQFTTQYLKALGITVVGHEFIPAGTTDVSLQLSKLKAAGAQAVASWASAFGLNVLTAGMQSIGWKAPVVLPNGFNTAQPVQSLVASSVASQVVCVCDRISVRPAGGLPSYIQQLLQIMKGHGQVTSLQLTALMMDEFTIARYGYEKAGKLSSAAAAKAIEHIGSDSSVGSSTLFFAYHGVNPGFTTSSHFPAVAPLLSDFFGIATVGSDVNGTYPGTSASYGS